MAVLDTGSGPSLFAGGFQGGTGNVSILSAGSWLPVGGGMNGAVRALAVYDDGSGPALYAGGEFSTAGGASANAIAKWNGSVWSPLGSGCTWALGAGDVWALAVFDDGSGPALYVGGDFAAAGGVPANNVAKWNGSGWMSVGGSGGLPPRVTALAVLNMGASHTLYAAAAGYILELLVSSWTPIGQASPLSVDALSAFDDGTGPALYAGGSFSAIGVPANSVAKWNGSSWSALGSGLAQSPGFAEAFSIMVFDDGSGPALYVAGHFNLAGGASVGNLAKWDGVCWSGLDLGPSGPMFALAAFDDGTTGVPNLFLGGQFSSVGAHPCSNVAEWLTCGQVGSSYCFDEVSGTPCPCGSSHSGVGGRGCPSSFGIGGRLRANGHATLSADTVTLLASDLPPSAVGLFFQGTTSAAGGLGVVFGDGLLCVNGTVRRLGIRSATNCESALGYAAGFDSSGAQVHDTPISIAGGLPSGGGRRYYQLWYRDPSQFCTSSTFNLTNGVRIDWLP